MEQECTAKPDESGKYLGLLVVEGRSWIVDDAREYVERSEKNCGYERF